MIHISEARSSRDREAIFALRYAVYVAEMGRRQEHADHERRLLEESEDANSTLLLARDARGDAIGTGRVHLGPCIPESYETMYQMRQFEPFHPTQTSTTTKLIVDERYRRSPVAFRLAQACYDVGMAAGVRFNFIDCNAHLKPFFLKLGFRQVAPDLVHPDFGHVSPLVLALKDFGYLRSIGSPFAPTASDASDASVGFIDGLLGQHNFSAELT